MPSHRPSEFHLDQTISEAKLRPIEPLFTYADLASALKVSVQTIEVWVKRGMIPSPHYYGVTARFTLEHLNTIRQGVQKPQTFPVSDSPRAAASRAGKTAAKQRKLSILRINTKKTKPAARRKGQGGK